MYDLIMCGAIDMVDIDARARSMLKLYQRSLAAQIPYENDHEDSIDTPETRALLARSASAGVVLLKNDDAILPIKADTVQRLAVIGSCAALALTSGGGAASVPYENFKTTPLDAITEMAAERDVQVSYAPGVFTHKFSPVLDPNMRHPDTGEKERAKIEFWKKAPSERWKDAEAEAGVDVGLEPDHVLNSRSTRCFVHDGVPEDICHEGHYARVSARRTHIYLCERLTVDHARLYPSTERQLVYRSHSR